MKLSQLSFIILPFQRVIVYDDDQNIMYDGEWFDCECRDYELLEMYAQHYDLDEVLFLEVKRDVRDN